MRWVRQTSFQNLGEKIVHDRAIFSETVQIIWESSDFVYVPALAGIEWSRSLLYALL